MTRWMENGLAKTVFVFCSLTLMFAMYSCDGGGGSHSNQRSKPKKIDMQLFVDERIASCVENKAEAEGWIYAEQVTSLRCWSNDIKSLAGLEQFNNLVEFLISDLLVGDPGGTVEDLTPLSSLTHLERIVIQNQHISDLSPLGNLGNLIELDLQINRVRNLVGLEGLTSLKSLDLRYNGLRDLTGIGDLTNLYFLRIKWSPVTDISALATASNLKELHIIGYPDLDIIDLYPLNSLIQLEILYIENIPVADLQPLSGLSFLRELTIHWYYGDGHYEGPDDIPRLIADLTPLADLINLEKLKIGSSLISDLRPIAGLINLESLKITNANISRLDGIESLFNLRYLDLRSNHSEITDTTLLSNLTQLERVEL